MVIPRCTRLCSRFDLTLLGSLLLAVLPCAAFAQSPEPDPALLAAVDVHKELLIVHPRVVDPFLNGGRSHNGGPEHPGGPWSFRRLIEDAARQANGGVSPTPAFLDAYLRSFFQSWLADVQLQDSVLPGRDPNLVAERLLDAFSAPTVAGEPLGPQQARHYELWRAPFELMAIVNRGDIHQAGSPNGELRFVYKLDSELGEPLFTLILEYPFPSDSWDPTTFAHEWHVLSALELGSEEYLQHLEYVTNRATQVRPRDSSMQLARRLGRMRTSEIVFASTCSGCPAPRWELREFRPAANGLLVPSSLFNGLRHDLNRTDTLARFVYCYQTDLNQFDNGGDDFTIPERFDSCPHDADLEPPGTSLLSGVEHMGSEFAWSIVTVDGQVLGQHDVRAIDHLGLLTCNGCHSENKAAGDRPFYHIDPEMLTDDLELLSSGRGRLSRFLTEGRRPGERSELERRRRSQALALEQASTNIDFRVGSDCTSDAQCPPTSLWTRTCQRGLCREPQHCRNWSNDMHAGEGGADCGGGCRRCYVGEACVQDSDCAEGIVDLACVAGFCAVPRCDDGHKNGTETDRDCGGICAPCQRGLGCSVDADCSTAHCATQRCADHRHCSNGLRDQGLESGADCGGACSRRCGLTASCASNEDCEADLLCEDSVCVSNSCADPALASTLDCVGLRRAGSACSSDGECQSGTCQLGVCFESGREALAGCSPRADADDQINQARLDRGLTLSGDGSCGGENCDPCGADDVGLCSPVNDGCQFDARCSSAEPGVSYGFCVPRRLVGDACSASRACEPGLICVGNLCQRP